MMKKIVLCQSQPQEPELPWYMQNSYQPTHRQPQPVKRPYDLPPPARDSYHQPLSVRGLIRESAVRDPYRSQSPSLKDFFQEPNPARDSHYQPDPSWDSCYHPEPSWDSRYQPEPSRDSRYQPEPSRDSRYQPDPSRDSRYHPEPSRDSRYQPDPSRDYQPQPVDDYHHQSEQPEAVSPPVGNMDQDKPWYSSTPESRKPLFLPAPFLCEVKQESCSRSNFACNLVRKLFSTEERRKSNVRGKLGKQQLDPTKMRQVRQATFQMYPCESRENEAHVWTYCCKAVDESCRRLNRGTLKENIQPQ